MSIMTHHHPRQHHHPHVYQYLVIALAVVIVVTGTLLIVPSITAPKVAVVPAAEFQSAHTEYLRGEKTIYLLPLGVTDALAAYHLGEKALHTRTINSSEAMTAYHFGEIHVMSAADSAMWLYHMGEKDY